MSRKVWLIVLIILAAVGGFISARFWQVAPPPVPSAAKLPASVRVRLQPFRQNTIDLTIAPGAELTYRVGMQAGATLVYAWATERGRDTLACEFADQHPIRAAEAHSAFVAQSSGWYRWRWKSEAAHPVKVHLKLTGYYEPTDIPYDR